MLFNIFINDIGEDLTVNNFPFLNGSKISRLLYADDLLLLSTSKTELQHNIYMINDFLYEMGSYNKCRQIKSCNLLQEWARIKGQVYVFS